jgi:hypothetical protein
MRGGLLSLVGATAASLVLACGVTARGLDTVSTATASSAHSVATVSGGATDPRAVIISVRASPAQRVTGSWMLHCSNGSKGGRIDAKAPVLRTFSFASGGTADCTARASAELSRDGHLTLQIIVRR